MPHTISHAEVEKSAALGRVKLTAEELADATKKLNDILGHFAAIQSIDTAHSAMADDISGLQNVTREDIAKPDILTTAETLLECAPAIHNGHIQVKAVFE